MEKIEPKDEYYFIDGKFIVKAMRLSLYDYVFKVLKRELVNDERNGWFVVDQSGNTAWFNDQYFNANYSKLKDIDDLRLKEREVPVPLPTSR